jgi:deoxyribose-phosphate aldolase
MLQRPRRVGGRLRAACARATFRAERSLSAAAAAPASAAAEPPAQHGSAGSYLPAPHVERNPGQPLDMSWATARRTNAAAIERRAGEIGARRSIKKEAQAAWLLRALTCTDLTTLAGDDTPGNVQRLCAKARNPVRADIMRALGVDHLPITTAAICVYPARVADAVAALAGTPINVAAVATGFPSGQIKLEHKLAEIRGAVADGATEIDIVIPRDKALRGDWAGVYEEVRLFREACGPAHLKTILATGELATYRNVATASMVCMMAGADFIKTSTGKEPTNATLAVSLVMARCIRDYHDATGFKIGFKPAGGISTAKSALVYQALMKDELGDEWLHPDLFRFGASSLLLDIERQLYHFTEGKYAAKHYMPMQ